ncbi:site-specific integrase [Methylobacterium sp. P31]
MIRRHAISALQLDKLTSSALSGYRDERLNKVQAGTVRRELALLQHCLEIARREWGTPLPTNPMHGITLPRPAKARGRRLGLGDGQKLCAAIQSKHAWHLRPLMELAVETSMRRGELLSLRWDHIDFEKRTAHLPITKNGYARTVALTPRAIAVLGSLPRSVGRVLPVSGNAVRLSWERLRARAGLPGLRFHDLRHEAVSRLFEAGLSIPEVALISGHRDTRMLMRYTHLKPESIAEKLARIDIERPI